MAVWRLSPVAPPRPKRPTGGTEVYFKKVKDGCCRLCRLYCYTVNPLLTIKLYPSLLTVWNPPAPHRTLRGLKIIEATKWWQLQSAALYRLHRLWFCSCYLAQWDSGCAYWGHLYSDSVSVSYLTTAAVGRLLQCRGAICQSNLNMSCGCGFFSDLPRSLFLILSPFRRITQCI